MKTVFDKNTIEELVNRLKKLEKTDNPQWGKMDSYQMLKHCTMSEEMFHGKKQYDRLFIGRLFGKMAKKSVLKDEKPLDKNQPTHPELKISSSGDFDSEKSKWEELLKSYAKFSNPGFVHPFFGKMTDDEIGKYVYKHTDHHLRQFGR